MSLDYSYYMYKNKIKHESFEKTVHVYNRLSKTFEFLELDEFLNIIKENKLYEKLGIE